MGAVLKSKAFKRVMIALASLLGLIILLIAGLLIWLQSSHAENFLRDFLTETLAEQGLYLKIDELEGPLPRRIFVRGLELADNDGVWFRASEFEARVKLVSLLKWQLNLPVLRADTPQLLRLPVLPPSGQPEAEPAPTTGKSAPFKLPIAFRLGSLKISNGQNGAGLLASAMAEQDGGQPDAQPDTQPDAQAGSQTAKQSGNQSVAKSDSKPDRQASGAKNDQVLPAMNLELAANGTLSNSGIALNLEAALLHKDGSGFAVTLLTGHKDTFSRDFVRDLQERSADSQVGGETTYWPLGLSADDRMFLSVSAREADGLVKKLAGQKDFPAYDIQIRGFGSPQDWRARLFATAGSGSGSVPGHTTGATQVDRTLDQGFVEAASRLGTVEGRLEFASENQNIDFASILDTRLSTDLKFTARPGPKSPQEASALLAPELALTIKAHLNKKRPNIESAVAETDGWRLALTELDIYSAGQRGTVINGNLAALLKNAAFLANLQPGTPEDAYDFIGQTAIDTRIHTETGGQTMQVRIDGNGQSKISGENLSIDYLLDASYKQDPDKGDVASLKELKLNALGINADASGNLDLQSGKLTLDASVKAAANGAWHQLLSRLSSGGADAEESPIPNGQLALSIKAESNELLPAPAIGATKGPRAPKTLASLNFEGSKMVWPQGMLRDLFDGPVQLEAKLEGSGANNGSYRVSLEKLEAGLLSGTGAATLSGAGGLADFGSLNPASTRLDSTFNLQLESLSPLLAAAGMSEAAPRQTNAGNGQPTAPAVKSPASNPKAPDATGSAASTGSTATAPATAQPLAQPLAQTKGQVQGQTNGQTKDQTTAQPQTGGKPAQEQFNAREGEIAPVPVVAHAVAGKGGRLVFRATGPLSHLDLEADLGLAELRSLSNVALRDIRGRVRGILQMDKTASSASSQPGSKTDSKAASKQGNKTANPAASSTASQPVRSSGNMALSFNVGSAGLFRMDSDWMLDLEKGRAGVSQFLAKARGLQMYAHADVNFAPSSTTKADSQKQQNALGIEAQANLNIQEWRTIAGLTGAKLGGDPATLEITLKPEAAGQKAEANWQTGHIYIYENNPDSHGVRQTVFSLNSSKGTVSIDDLLNLPVINLTASTGIGRAGRISWSSGEANVDSNKEEGRFKVALYGWQRRNTANAQSGSRTDAKANSSASGSSSNATAQKANNQQDAESRNVAAQNTGKTVQNGQAIQNRQNSQNGQTATAAQRPRGRERLALEGAFKLAAPSVTLEKFVFRSNNDATNITLASPALIDLSHGVLVPDFSLAMKPSGTLKASANIVGDDMTVALDAQSVSMQVASLFTDALLPKGHLNARLDLSKKGADLNGQALAEAVLTPSVTDLHAQGSATDLASLPEAERTAQTQEAGNAQQQSTPEALQAEAEQPDTASPFTFRLAANIAKTPSGKFEAVRQQAGITYLSGEGSVSYAGANKDSKAARLVFDFPLQANGQDMPVPSMNRPLGLHLAWQGHTAPIWSLIPLSDREFKGYGQIDLKVGGTLTVPRYDGHIYLLNGRYEDKILGLMLENIRLEGRGNDKEFNLLASLEDGQNGNVKIEGAIQAPRNTAATAQTLAESEPPHLSVRGQINHLRPLHRDDLEIQLSGILGAKGPLNALAISANLELERGQFTLLNSLGGGVRTLDIEVPDEEQPEAPPTGMPLDVTLNIPNRFYIRGFGLESEWAGNINVKGDTATPLVSGEIRPVRGYFDLLTKPFVFSKGGIYLDGQAKVNPRLDLGLTYTGPSLTAIINIIGTANRPKFELTSNPVLPKDQILSEVLFGKSFSNLSRFEAIQVANSLRELSGGTGLDLFGTLRQGFGLDMLRIGSGESTGQQQRNTYGTIGASDMGGGSSSNGEEESMPTLEAGKYINDAIYVGVEQGVTENSTGVKVEVELRHNLTFEGRSNVQS
ncbi:translocation/assembly module TamB domain-containing protein, partial [Desulfovibrio sp. OttesenSCG-928-C06]|nr:translocation/assembly module TamB domain-containing protein [Desulfovibrio sp. OttesenSCG-928-C06]